MRRPTTLLAAGAVLAAVLAGAAALAQPDDPSLGPPPTTFKGYFKTSPLDGKAILKEHEDKFPIPPDLFTIEDLGGWDKVMTDFFDPDNGKIAAIQKDLGAPIE